MDINNVEKLLQDHYGLPYPPMHYYMPIANPKAVMDNDLDRKPIMPPGDLFDDAKILSFLEVFSRYADEQLSLPVYADIHAMNIGLGFGEVEGHAYYSLVRDRQPDVILEVGCGTSTHYANLARKQNTTPCRIICVEPYPATNFITYCEQEDIDLRIEPFQKADVDALVAELSPRSIIFIDTTHVLRVDGELPRVFFDLLPKLPSGSLIHFHDIFLPYPVLFREHNSSLSTFVWNESMALGLFLSHNKDFEVLHPQYWMSRHHTEAMMDAFPRLKVTHQAGSSFWMQRK